MASSGFSSSSSSAPARSSSQPLHNFELPPMLRWNNREGQHSGGSHRRWRSMKPAPQRPNSFSASPLRRSPPPPRGPRFEAPMREFSAPPPPRHQSHPARESLVDHREIREPVFNHELERLSYMREEVIRNYRSRDWWTESGQADVIPYRRNPHRRSGFSPSPARLGPSSSTYPDGVRRYDADRGFDVYHRNAYRRSSFAGGDAYNNNRSPSPLRRHGFGLESEENRLPAFHRRSGLDTPSNHHPLCLSSHSYPTDSDYRKSGFSSPRRRSRSWNSGERKVKMREDGASTYPQPQCQYPDDKGSGFSEANKKAKVGEADADSSSKLPLDKSAGAGAAEDKLQNPMVAEADASMAFSPNKEETKKEEKSKADAETAAAESKGKGKEMKEENPDDEEDVKVWNLRPRNVKSKDKGKSKAQPSRHAGEKKEKKKLSIEISLTKQEIEEDIYALTGAKPSRRPKKRQKNVQKQLDSVFPGLWLQSITPESYKVSENSLKHG